LLLALGRWSWGGLVLAGGAGGDLDLGRWSWGRSSSRQGELGRYSSRQVELVEI